MVEGNASMYLGSPRMAEMVVGEITDLEEMGGARMHATVSGCGDNLVADDAAAIEAAKAYFLSLIHIWIASSWSAIGPGQGFALSTPAGSSRAATPSTTK